VDGTRLAPHDPMERRQGLRAPSVGTPTGRGKGTGVAPTHGGVTQPEATMVVVVQGRLSGGGGAGHHDDHSGGCVGRRSHETVQEPDR
jgi:hypothetical protein